MLAFILLGVLGLATYHKAVERTDRPPKSAVADRPPAIAPSEIFEEFLHQLSTAQSPPASILETVIGGTWIAQGPAPILRGQTENLPGPNPVSGAVHRIIAHPTDANIIYIGAVNGGIWRTANATASSPNWTPLTDQFPSLSIGALEFDATDPNNQTLVAGIGRFSSFGGSGGPQTGLLRSTDGGNTWTQLGQTELANRNIVAVGPRGNTILVATNGGTNVGMYRSIDNGATFQFISGRNGLDTGLVFDLASDPSNPLRFYAGVRGVRGGVYRTDDAGATWFNVSDPEIVRLIGGTTGNIKLAVSAAAGNPVYLGIVVSGGLAGLFRSANLGGTWTAMDLPQTLGGGANVTNATNASPIVITSATAHGLSTGNRVRIAGITGNTAANGDFTVTVVNTTQFSLNGSMGNGAYLLGGTWRLIEGIHPGGQGGTHFSLLADRSSPNLVYIGGDRQGALGANSPIGAAGFSGRLFRGDAGVPRGGPSAIPSPQWTPLTHIGTASRSSPHADSRDMAFDANDDLIEGDDGGIYRRTKPQTTTGDWFSVIGDLQVTEFHDVAYDTNSNIVIGGAQDTGTSQQTTAGGTTWNSVSTGDGGDVAVDVDTFTLAGTRQSIRYSSSQNLGGFRRQVFDSANTQVGSSVGLIPAGGLAGFIALFVTPIAVNTIPPPSGQSTRLVIGGGINMSNPVAAIYEATNAGLAPNAAGVNWTRIPTGAGFGSVNGNAMAYGGRRGGVINPDVLYIGSTNRVFVRTKEGGTLNPTATLPAGAGTIVDIVIDPNDWMTAFAIDTNQVFQTTNAGATWTDITGSLAVQTVNFRTLAFIPGPGNDKLAVGTNQGVFVSFRPLFNSWLKLGENLPKVPVWDLDYDPVDDLLLAGTLGRGAWILKGVSQVTTKP